MIQPQGPELFSVGRIQELAPRSFRAAVTVPQPAISQRTAGYQAASRESSAEVTSQQLEKGTGDGDDRVFVNEGGNGGRLPYRNSTSEYQNSEHRQEHSEKR